MRTLLDCLQAHDELVPGKDGYSEQVRRELLAMSASTVASIQGRSLESLQPWRRSAGGANRTLKLLFKRGIDPARTSAIKHEDRRRRNLLRTVKDYKSVV